VGGKIKDLLHSYRASKQWANKSISRREILLRSTETALRLPNIRVNWTPGGCKTNCQLDDIEFKQKCFLNANGLMLPTLYDTPAEFNGKTRLPDFETHRTAAWCTKGSPQAGIRGWNLAYKRAETIQSRFMLNRMVARSIWFHQN